MRVLYSSILDNRSSASSLNPNASFPVTNLFHEFLQKTYKSTDTTDTISIALDNAYDADCVAFGYHNLTQMVVRLYNLADSLVHTETINSPRVGEMKYFTSVNVKRLEIDLTAGSDCFLGGVYLGEHLQMPYSSTTPSFGRRINSYTRQTGGGQSTGQKRGLLKGFDFNFPLVTQSQLDNITTMLETVQNVDKLFLDTWEGSTYLPPIYSRIDAEEFNPTQDDGHGVLYSGGLRFIECK